MAFQYNIYRVSRMVGRSHFEKLVTWAPTIGKYSVIGGLGVIWMCDWKLVGQYIPYWGGRFNEPKE